jgi:heterodisulfide reductase subunit A-like polyferredoxin
MKRFVVSGFLAVLSRGALAALQPQNTTTPQSNASADIIERDVAIIGGGSAGTYSAVRLKDMGKSVVVIEKDVILGGQTDTYSEYYP